MQTKSETITLRDKKLPNETNEINYRVELWKRNSDDFV